MRAVVIVGGDNEVGKWILFEDDLASELGEKMSFAKDHQSVMCSPNEWE